MESKKMFVMTRRSHIIVTQTYTIANDSIGVEL